MKRIRLLLFILTIILSATGLQAQQSQIDSLRKVLDKQSDDTNRVNTLTTLAFRLAVSNPREAFPVTSQALQLAERLKFERGVAASFNVRGIAHNNLANFDSALHYYLRSLEIMEKLKNKKGIASCLNNIGELYEKYFEKYEDAIEYHNKSLLIKEEIGNVRGTGSSYTNLASAYRKLKDYPEAMKYYEKALKIHVQFNDQEGLAEIYNGIGDVYKAQREYSQALDYYRKALFISEEGKNPNDMARDLFSVGSTFSEQNRFKESSKMLLQSVEYARQVNQKTILQKCYAILAYNMEKSKQLPLAAEYYKLALAYKDSISADNNRWALAEMQVRFNDKVRQQEVERLNKERATEQKILYMMIGGVVLMLFFVGYIFRANSKMREFNKELLFKNNEINQQKEEIMAQRDHLEEKTLSLQNAHDEIVKQKEEIESQRDNIEKQHNQIAAALEDIKLLSKVGQELTATLDFETTFIRLYQYVADMMTTDCFRIMIRDEENNILEDTYCIEKGKRLAPEKISMNETSRLSVVCVRQNAPIFISDYASEYKKYTPGLQIQVSDDMPQSIIYLPLTIEDKVVGVITVQSFKRDAYNEYEFNVLKTLAAYAAIALDNARAYEYINSQSKIIAEKNKHITDSLRYAETMQKALLPPEDLFKKLFSEYFILYMPRDIVSGDFYWCCVEEDRIFVAVVDCTGHGVPGAFMSLIGISLLNEIVKHRNIYSPALILEELHKGVQLALKQENKSNDDGMDVCLCMLENVPYDSIKVTFSGAKRPLLYKSDDSPQVVRVKGDNKPIGGWHKSNTSHFTNTELLLNKGDTIYLMTDGLPDQDGDDRQKFGMEKLTTMLEGLSFLNLPEQKQEITHELHRFRNTRPQRDDISIVAIKL